MESGFGLGARIITGEGISPNADVIFASTDWNGAPGALNRYVLEQMGLSQASLPGPDQLGGGYAIMRVGDRLLCFIVTVHPRLAASQALKKNLEAALKDQQFAKARSIWIPLMGTGDGQLAPGTSESIIQNALERSGWSKREGVQITISRPPSSASFYPAHGPAIDGLLRLAAGLQEGQTKPSGSISGRLLVHALSLATHPNAPSALAADEDAKSFAAALAAADDGRIEAAWRRYFHNGFVFNGAAVDVDIPGPSPNLQAVFSQAHSIAQEAGHQLVQIDDLINALLAAAARQKNHYIETLVSDPKALLRTYQIARSGRVALTLHNDVAAETDRLGYSSYANAIAAFVTNAQTPPPLSVSIQAPWGVGKSSLMQMVRNQLDPPAERRGLPGPAVSKKRLVLGQVLKFLDRQITPAPKPGLQDGRRWTVWFNAWKYENSEQVWAGLVNAIVDQISERLPPVERELFLLKLQLARIDDGVVRRKIHDRVASLWWGQVRHWLGAGGAVIAGLVGLGAAAKADVVPSGLLEAIYSNADLLAALGFNSAIALQVLLGVALFTQFLVAQQKVKSEPAHFSLAEYLSVPDYDRAMGAVHHIHADLLKVLSIIPKQGDQASPLVVFIDDLDRCAPANVAALVEGVSAILASNVPCVFIIGMDPQMVAAALEKAHADVRSRLPSYERSVPLGWRFMDKFIQLPFTIPPTGGPALKAYVDHLGRPPAPPEPELLAASPPDVGRWGFDSMRRYVVEVARRFERRARVTAWSPDLSASAGADAAVDAPSRSTIEASAAEAFEEGRDVGLILTEVLDLTAGNPRELKRVANLARFYLQLRNARREQEPGWSPPEARHYARWISLTLRWPDMMRWLQWGADEQVWSEASNSLVVRRLTVLQEAASTALGHGAWCDDVRTRLNLTIAEGELGHWLRDTKLYEFFQREGKQEEGHRLSDAAKVGFW